MVKHLLINRCCSGCSTNVEQCTMSCWMFKLAIQHVECCWTRIEKALLILSKSCNLLNNLTSQSFYNVEPKVFSTHSTSWTLLNIILLLNHVSFALSLFHFLLQQDIEKALEEVCSLLPSTVRSEVWMIFCFLFTFGILQMYNACQHHIMACTFTTTQLDWIRTDPKLQFEDNLQFRRPIVRSFKD